MQKGEAKKRAIALAGGGPAAGLHIGALAALEEAGIDFKVFCLSCVGAWVGIVYNTRTPGGRAGKTLEYFQKYCFRDDRSYEWFPVNRGFAPDFASMWRAWASFPFSAERRWDSLWPRAEEVQGSMQRWFELFGKPPFGREFNYWMLNDFLAVNPWTRYMTALMFKSEVKGLSKIYYKDSEALCEAFRRKLSDPDMPEIYHNAWRLPTKDTKGRMQIFHNRAAPPDPRSKDYLEISPQSLCACSALPFIEENVTFDDGVEYSEGALVDTVNFANLLRDHRDLDEVWVSRIVDESQVKPAHTLGGALANLPMQFAAEVGEDDIKLFRQHLLNQSAMRPRVVEVPIHPDTEVTFDWSLKNLKRGFDEGKAAVEVLLRFDPQLKERFVQ
ncbi:patatin-like phospholipase family protein [Ramlibacter alkalitolerans]|uniref:Patatin-like phospholipase family protein n=1 Tax=Ramlibacter alkalitolerans TaxID=2039631 RepID=A0ABS1JXH2_9BURK|nr:patatin-like phospholipase family protein [Ramlibacter alkalitolerans]MBL0428867.1 patatin-like phospholipase family protein [Ramlibacter alkalitolerans]